MSKIFSKDVLFGLLFLLMGKCKRISVMPTFWRIIFIFALRDLTVIFFDPLIPLKRIVRNVQDYICTKIIILLLLIITPFSKNPNFQQ